MGAMDLLEFDWGGVGIKYCSPVWGGVWETQLENGFGPYTPCLVDSVVLGTSYLFLIGLVLRRIYLLRSPDTKKFSVQSKYRHAFAIVLSSACAVAPFMQLILGISTAKTDAKSSLPVFEVNSRAYRRPVVPTMEASFGFFLLVWYLLAKNHAIYHSGRFKIPTNSTEPEDDGVKIWRER